MKVINVFAVAAIAMLYAVQGMAGAVLDESVSIDLDARTAQGAQVTARFSDNETEVIGCGGTVTSDGVNPLFKFGFCQATNADGVRVVCFTQDSDLVDAINSVANYGFIRFSWNEDEECVAVRNSTQSLYIPDFSKSQKSKKSKK